jgi:hypothetical protein
MKTNLIVLIILTVTVYSMFTIVEIANEYAESKKQNTKTIIVPSDGFHAQQSIFE